MQVPFKKPLITEHTVFTVKMRSNLGLKLQTDTFSPYKDLLTSPCDYSSTQQLGASMRKNGVEIFQYASARDIDDGINVATFTPEAIGTKSPEKMHEWLCHTTPSTIGFSSVRERNKRYSFTISNFLHGDALPTPAA